MSSRFTLTPAQKVEWTAIMKVRIPDSNNSRLAAKMNLDTSTHLSSGANYDKTVAGYLGQLRLGNEIGIRFFLGNPHRLEALARVCEYTADGFYRDLGATRRLGDDADDRIFLPGFEDLGEVPLEEGFVMPPVSGRDGKLLSEEDVRKAAMEASSTGWVVGGPHGAGTTTLLKRVARWLEEEGWRRSRWTGALPGGRSLVFLADTGDDLGGIDDVTLRMGDLNTWMRSMILDPKAADTRLRDSDHRLLRAGRGGYRIGPVDEVWLRSYREKVRRLSERRFKWKLVDDRFLADLARGNLGPEEAGIRLRERLEPSSRAPFGAVCATIRRRLTAQDQPTDALHGIERWLPDLVMASLRDPNLDVTEACNQGVAAGVRAIIDGRMELKAPERDFLRSVLPLVSGESVRKALVRSHLLDESGGRSRIRLAWGWAPELREKLVQEPETLRKCVVGRNHDVLNAVVDDNEGARVLCTLLDQLDASVLRTTLQDPDALWLEKARFSERLVARMVALAELSDDGKALRKKLSKFDPDPDLLRWAPGLFDAWKKTIASLKPALTGRPVPLPDLETMAWAWSEVASDLGMDPNVPTPDELRWFRAFHLAHIEDLACLEVWASTPDDILIPPAWLDVAMTAPSVARVLLNPGGPMGMRILESRRTRTAGVRVLATLFETDPDVASSLAEDILGSVHERFLSGIAGCVRRGAHSDSLEDHATEALLHEWSSLAKRLEVVPMLLGMVRRPALVHQVLGRAIRSWIPTSLPESDLRPVKSMGNPIQELLILLSHLNPEERTALLRTPDSRLGPFWPEAAMAGVPQQALLALARDLQSGALAIPHSRSAGTLSEGELPESAGRGEGTAQPMETLAMSILRAVLANAPADEPEPDLSAWPHPHLPAEDWESREWSGCRRWLWRQHRSLADSDVLWSLLSARAYGTPYMAALHASPEGVVRHAIATWRSDWGWLLAMDQKCISTALSSTSVSHLDATHWEVLVRAGIMVDAPPEALLHAVENPHIRSLPEEYDRGKRSSSHWRPRKTFLALLSVLVTPSTRPQLQVWLRENLSHLSGTLDQEDCTRLWMDVGFLAWELEALLGACAGDEVGMGIVPALLHLDPSALTRMLENPRTRTAAMSAMAREPELRIQLASVLSEMRACPSRDFLRTVLRLRDPDPVTLIGEAAESWPVPEQRILWQRVAGQTASAHVRERAWRRLAELSVM